VALFEQTPEMQTLNAISEFSFMLELTITQICNYCCFVE